MEQNAVVTSVLDNGSAYVSVRRQSACAKDCSKCVDCALSYNKSITALADNPVCAVEGDIVLVRSDTKSVMTIAALVYIVPLLLFFLGYGMAASYDVTPFPCAAAGGLTGWLLCWIYNRRLMKKHTASCIIVSVLKKRHPGGG